MIRLQPHLIVFFAIIIAGVYAGPVIMTRVFAHAIVPFERRDYVQLDDATYIDLIQDTRSGVCWAVYVFRDIQAGDAATASLGVVACTQKAAK